MNITLIFFLIELAGDGQVVPVPPGILD